MKAGIYNLEHGMVMAIDRLNLIFAAVAKRLEQTFDQITSVRKHARFQMSLSFKEVSTERN